MRLTLAALALSAAAITLPAPDLRADDSTVSVASLLRQETDFTTLPLHRDWRTNLTSSCDPTGGNHDYQHFVSLQGNHALLADLKGPGAIVRFWATAVYKDEKGNLTSAPSGQLKIFIDDNPTPVIDEPFADFFDKHEPFTKPLTDHYGAASISYFPIPYAKHCLVTLEKPQEQFYQIQSIAFPAGTKVRPFALPMSKEDEAAWNTAGEMWRRIESQAHDISAMLSPLEPGRKLETNLSAGPATVHFLSLYTSDKVTNLTLRKLILRAWFDDHETPDIEVPVADFFGNAYGLKDYSSFFLSQFTFKNPKNEDTKDIETFICTFPMPYRSKARFEIENLNQEAVDLELFPQDQPAPFTDNTEYFHADFDQEITKSGRAHAWLKIAKQPGHFIGVVQTMQSGQTLGYCEGDDQVRVDEQAWGKTTPDFPNTVVGPWNGTGTEDCFNSAWYFQDGIVSRPMNGCLVREDLGRINTYRFFLNDAPVWQDSIDAQIEIGATNEGDGNYYSSVAYWYGPGERQPIEPFPANLDFPTIQFTDRNVASTVIEGESLLASAHATAGAVSYQIVIDELDAWSNGAQLAWTGAKKGDTLDLVINIPKAGDYSLTAYVGHGPDYGPYQVAIAGKSLAGNDNASDPEPHNVRQDWGQSTLPAGPCHITITQLDPDPRSNGTLFGLDVLDLHLDKPASP